MTTTLDKFMSDNAITVESEFVPFSQSRNKDNKQRSLNWRVTLMLRGKPVYLD